ncbi:MAG: hypothetical protein NC548_11380 [Lachnospiraceae bacterium]|nr:hypothetical protein [Lachnospiraceae bacterium]
MKPVVKHVKDYWKRHMPLLNIDTDTMSDCVAALTMEERATIAAWNPFTDPNEEVAFLLSKVLNRHNDVCAGSTAIVNDKGNYVVEITAQSSISELDISLSTLRGCNRACIYHIEDIDKEILPTLSFEAIADLTSAILVADSIEVDTGERGHRVAVQNACNCDGVCPSCECKAKE